MVFIDQAKEKLCFWPVKQIKSPEIHTHGGLFLDNDTRSFSVESITFSIKMPEQFYICKKGKEKEKKNLNPYFTHCIKKKIMQMYIDLNVGAKPIKLLEENIR